MFEKVLNKYRTYEKYAFYFYGTYFVFQLSTMLVLFHILYLIGTQSKYSGCKMRTFNKYCTYLVRFQTLYLIETQNKYYEKCVLLIGILS